MAKSVKKNIFRNCGKLSSAMCLVSAAILSLTAAALPCNGQNAWTTNDNAAHNIVWEEKLYREISFLSDSLCGGRATGSAGGNEAAFYIMRRFRQSGLMAFGGSYAKHIFAGGGLIGHNVMGMIQGSRKFPSDSYIIVGAHYDHLGTLKGKMYPGADSNASGTAALLSLADMFSSMKLLGKSYGKNIIFVAFDANCMNLAGSYALWRMIENGELHDPATGSVITPDKVSLMVNMDQIGSSLSPLASGRRDYMIMLGNGTLPKEDRWLIGMCNAFYDTDLELSHTYYGSETFTRVFSSLSDQRVFMEHGIPSVLFTSGITLNNNKTSDTPDSLDMKVMRLRIILIFHWLEKVMK